MLVPVTVGGKLTAREGEMERERERVQTVTLAEQQVVREREGERVGQSAYHREITMMRRQRCIYIFTG